jgi:hypothetical protein
MLPAQCGYAACANREVLCFGCGLAGLDETFSTELLFGVVFFIWIYANRKLAAANWDQFKRFSAIHGPQVHKTKKRA